MQLMILRQADIDPRSTPRYQGRHVPEVSNAHDCRGSFCLKVFLEMVMLFHAQAPVDRPPLHRDGGSGPCVSVGYAFRRRRPNLVQHRAGRVQLVATRPDGVGAEERDACCSSSTEWPSWGCRLTSHRRPSTDGDPGRRLQEGSGAPFWAHLGEGRDSHQWTVHGGSGKPAGDGPQRARRRAPSLRGSARGALSPAELHGVASTPERGNGANLEMVVISRDGNPGDLSQRRA